MSTSTSSGAAPSKEACLITCTAVVGGDISFVPISAECGLGEGTKRFYLRIPVGVRRFLFCLVDVPRDTKAGGVVVFLVGFFLLQGLNLEIPADLCRDLLALCLAPDDVHGLAGCEAEVVLCDNEGKGVSGNGLVAVAVGFVCIDADIRQSVRGKGCLDTGRAEFVGCCGNTCIRYLLIAIKNPPPPIKIALNKANILLSRIQYLYR